MSVKKRDRKVMGVITKHARRLPWRKEMALAALFTGTPFITGDMELRSPQPRGVGIGALLIRRVTVSRTKAQTATLRQNASPFPAALAASTTPGWVAVPRIGEGGTPRS